MTKTKQSIGKKMLRYLYRDGIITCKNALRHFGCSNVSREIIRQIETPYNIKLKRRKIVSRNRYNNPVHFFEYSLPANQHSKVRIILETI